MPLFKTKYNDLKKAIEALAYGNKAYDIDRANEEFFKDSRFVSLVVEKFGVGILDRTGEWVYDDWSVMSAAYEKDKAIIEKMSPAVRFKFCPPEERLYWLFKQIGSKTTILLARGDHPEYAFNWYGNDGFKVISGSSAYSKYNDLAYMLATHKWGCKKGMIFDKNSNMVIFAQGFSNIIFFSVEEFLRDNKNKIADLINLSFPEELIGKPEAVKGFNFDNWFQPKHKTEIFDQEYLKNIIIPFVDNLLLGKKINISGLGENKSLFSKIIHDGLSSLPVDKANSYSFATEMGVDKYFDCLQIQDAQRSMTDNTFVLDAEKGCEKYIPQTEYAKQMLSKINQSESKQSAEEVVEQTKSERKTNDHELS